MKQLDIDNLDRFFVVGVLVSTEVPERPPCQAPDVPC